MRFDISAAITFCENGIIVKWLLGLWLMFFGRLLCSQGYLFGSLTLLRFRLVLILLMNLESILGLVDDRRLFRLVIVHIGSAKHLGIVLLIVS